MRCIFVHPPATIDRRRR